MTCLAPINGQRKDGVSQCFVHPEMSGVISPYVYLFFLAHLVDHMIPGLYVGSTPQDAIGTNKGFFWLKIFCQKKW